MNRTANRYATDSFEGRGGGHYGGGHHGYGAAGVNSTHAIGFQVSSPVIIRGAGTFGITGSNGAKVQVTLQLLSQEQQPQPGGQRGVRQRKKLGGQPTAVELAHTTAQLLAVNAGYDIEEVYDDYNDECEACAEGTPHQHVQPCTEIQDVTFPQPVPIKAGVNYVLQLTMPSTDTNGYYVQSNCGYNGRESITCGSVVFTFHAADFIRNNQTTLDQGQIPCVLFDNIMVHSHHSHQKAVFELAVPMSNPTFSKTTEKVSLHRFILSLTGKRNRNNILASLKCLPSCKETSWMFEVETELTILHDRDHAKSLVTSSKVTFDQSTTTAKLADQNIDALTGLGFNLKEDIVLQVTVRYVTVSDRTAEQPWVVETFDESWKGSDVVITVEGKSVHCHSQILSLASPVFAKMLEGAFREATTKSIDLPGKKHATFTTFLQFVYPRLEPLDLAEETAYDIMELLHEFDVAPLEVKAEKKLAENVGQVNALRYLVLAYRCGLENLKEKALQVATTISSSVLQRDRYFLHLSDETKYLIQEIRLLNLEGASGAVA